MDDMGIPSAQRAQNEWDQPTQAHLIKDKIIELFDALNMYKSADVIRVWSKHLCSIEPEVLTKAIDQIISTNDKRDVSIAGIKQVAAKISPKKKDDNQMTEAKEETKRRYQDSQKCIQEFQKRGMEPAEMKEWVDEYFLKVYGDKFHKQTAIHGLNLKPFKEDALARIYRAGMDLKKAIKSQR